MPAVESVRIELDAPSGMWMEIVVIPRFRNASPAVLVDASADSDESGLNAIQLLESTEYRYRLSSPSDAPLTTSRPELFEPDDSSGRSGRIKTGLSVGSIPVAVYQDGACIGSTALEVRSRKLDYRSEYQWMLRDIAEEVAEVVMERFASSEQTFRPDYQADSRTAYQRFAFLKALVEDQAFVAALHRVTQRPHVAWELETEQRASKRGVRSSSRLARDLTRFSRGHRLRVSSGHDIPETISVARAVENLDNVANRFVVFALRRWLDEIETIRDALANEHDAAHRRRGLVETSAVRAVLEDVLFSSALRDVGTLERVPTNNTVLLARAGYREVYRAFIQFELAARLGWRGGDSVYEAGQKNVAALYEYWAFVQLAKCLAEICDDDFSLSQLIQTSHDGLSMGLKRGEEAAIRGTLRRRGRLLRVELWFNRTFSQQNRATGSWTRTMRPDCSLLIEPTDSLAGDAGSIWLHFDAKYRVESLSEIFENNEGVDRPAIAADRSKRDDLLKMHAYRDAIRRSAGAYVLYPGQQRETFREYHELLPGLGAFALRPEESGEVMGRQVLRGFLNAVLDHASNQTTQHERGRYWTRRVATGPSLTPAVDTVEFLSRPPADTRALLCYAKSSEHFRWIHDHSLYNMRADGRRGSLDVDGPELGAELVLVYARDEPIAHLYRVAGAPLLLTRDDLVAQSYPEPRGRVYFCMPLESLATSSVDLRSASVANAAQTLRARRAFGQPIATDWASLLKAMTPPSAPF